MIYHISSILTTTFMTQLRFSIVCYFPKNINCRSVLLKYNRDYKEVSFLWSAIHSSVNCWFHFRFHSHIIFNSQYKIFYAFIIQVSYIIASKDLFLFVILNKFKFKNFKAIL